MNEEVHIEEMADAPFAAGVRRVSWGAIFAGIIVTIVIQLMLTLLGTAIGAATVNPQSHQNSGEGLAIGSAIWLLVSGLISLWVGACVAGRLCGGPRRADGMLHGIVTWSASTLAMVLMLATAAGALLGGTGALLGGLVSSSQQSGGSSMMASAKEGIRQAFPEVGKMLPPTGRTEASQPAGNLTALAQQDPELGAALARLAGKSADQQAPQDREQVINLLTSKHNLSQQEASQLLDQGNQQAQQAQAQVAQKARQIGAAATHGLSQGALWSFVALFLGMLVAAWGGWAGTASLPRLAAGTTVVD